MRCLLGVSVSVVFVFFESALCDEHYSNHSRDFGNFRSELHSLKRARRFLTFQTLDDDLSVGLEFIVPFINIPVKQTSDSASGVTKGMANVNLAALVLSGITVLTGVSVASIFGRLGSMVTGGKNTRSGRLMDDISAVSLGYRSSNGEKAKAPLGDIMSNIESIFRDNDIDLTLCVQKTVCLLVHQSTENVLRGEGTSTNKLVDGLSSTNWLLNFISGTAIKEAIDVGRSHFGCSFKYKDCNWPEEDIFEFIDAM